MKQFDYIVDLMRIAVEDAQPIRVTGRVLEVKGTIIKAVVPAVKVGEVCILRNPGEQPRACRPRWSASPRTRPC